MYYGLCDIDIDEEVHVVPQSKLQVTKNYYICDDHEEVPDALMFPDYYGGYDEWSHDSAMGYMAVMAAYIG